MHKLQALSVSIAIAYAVIMKWWGKIAPIVEPIVKEIEAMALARTIGKDQRKKIAMDAINRLEDKGMIQLNWLERLVIGKVVDVVAERLPDFTVQQNVKDIIIKSQR